MKKLLAWVFIFGLLALAIWLDRPRCETSVTHTLGSGGGIAMATWKVCR